MKHSSVNPTSVEPRLAVNQACRRLRQVCYAPARASMRATPRPQTPAGLSRLKGRIVTMSDTSSLPASEASGGGPHTGPCWRAQVAGGGHGGRELQSNNEIDLTNVRELRNLLYAHNMRPNKSFGQNLLIDRSVLLRIVEAAAIDSTDQVLELGAGTGVLTRELARRARRVVAVELEKNMLALLAETTRQYANVELLARNLLYVDPTQLFGHTPYKLVANLPYYITAPTFRHFLESDNPPVLLVVMVQYEVAQRIVAGPGDLSLLGVSVQFYGRPQIIARVPAQAFYPAPKVDSAILRVDVSPQAPLTPNERDSFFRVVQAGFSERRKQLHNALASGLHRKNEIVRNWLTMANIDPGRRAETLSIEEWLRLWREVERSREETL
jgi:16S rRNA (adenine1518-N6/adenine1519-N6)-dimethyltransferase